MLTRSFCAATAEHEHSARDASPIGSAGASPSHRPSYGREGEAPADPQLPLLFELSLVSLGIKVCHAHAQLLRSNSGA